MLFRDPFWLSLTKKYRLTVFSSSSYYLAMS